MCRRQSRQQRRTVVQHAADTAFHRSDHESSQTEAVPLITIQNMQLG